MLIKEVVFPCLLFLPPEKHVALEILGNTAAYSSYTLSVLCLVLQRRVFCVLWIFSIPVQIHSDYFLDPSKSTFQGDQNSAGDPNLAISSSSSSFCFLTNRIITILFIHFISSSDCFPRHLPFPTILMSFPLFYF